MEPTPDGNDRREEDPGGFAQTLKKDFEKFHRWNPRSAIVGGADRMFVGRFWVKPLSRSRLHSAFTAAEGACVRVAR
jgi:hypothetical protein